MVSIMYIPVITIYKTKNIEKWGNKIKQIMYKPHLYNLIFSTNTYRLYPKLEHKEGKKKGKLPRPTKPNAVIKERKKRSKKKTPPKGKKLLSQKRVHNAQ